MLTIDTDELVVRFPTIFQLMRDLKGMGENSATWTRKPHLHRDTYFNQIIQIKDFNLNYNLIIIITG